MAVLTLPAPYGCRSMQTADSMTSCQALAAHLQDLLACSRARSKPGKECDLLNNRHDAQQAEEPLKDTLLLGKQGLLRIAQLRREAQIVL